LSLPVNGQGNPSDVIILFFYDIYAKKAFHPAAGG
jgi:hypothetical protein